MLYLNLSYKIHDARYMMYWMALSNNQYQFYLDSIAYCEKEKLALQKRTIDFVAPGEQQPEADHSIQKQIQIQVITWMNFGEMPVMVDISVINYLPIKKLG